MKWDRDVDVLVFGAGMGGMTAALIAAHEGLDVLLCEKTDQVGGTTSTSAGTIWVPGSSQAVRDGVPDNMDEARRFEWLVAMDDGQVLATGTPDEFLARTGSPQLEQAFIHLLPEAKRRGWAPVEIAPLTATDDDIAIEAREPPISGLEETTVTPPSSST